MEERYIIIGNNFRYFRKKEQYTQEKLAELLNISTNHLYKIENGKIHMSLPVLLKAKDLFKVTANERLEDPAESIATDYPCREIVEILEVCNVLEKEIIVRNVKDLYETLKAVHI